MQSQGKLTEKRIITTLESKSESQIFEDDCFDMVEIMILEEAIDALVAIIVDPKLSLKMRERAALCFNRVCLDEPLSYFQNISIDPVISRIISKAVE